MNVQMRCQIKYEIIGNGETILNQTPNSNDVISYDNSKIILYTVNEDQYVNVPSFVGLSLFEAANEAVNIGLNIKIKGSGGGTVITQSLPLGALVKKGEIIELYTMVTDYED